MNFSNVLYIAHQFCLLPPLTLYARDWSAKRFNRSRETETTANDSVIGRRGRVAEDVEGRRERTDVVRGDGVFAGRLLRYTAVAPDPNSCSTSDAVLKASLMLARCCRPAHSRRRSPKGLLRRIPSAFVQNGRASALGKRFRCGGLRRNRTLTLDQRPPRRIKPVTPVGAGFGNLTSTPFHFPQLKKRFEILQGMAPLSI